jgi:radical SAM protein with 4Fe4S-binding SPASM domain
MQFPSFIQFYPTLRCNQRCGFCFNQNIATPYGDMPEEDAYRLSSMLRENGCPEIDILGGEPMLVPWMSDFVNHVTGSGFLVNISTNGSLPHVVDRLSKNNTGLLNIGFSLHGFSEVHHSLTAADNFSLAVTGIQKMIEKGKNPIVKSTLTRVNANDIRPLVKYLRDLGVKRYYLLYEDSIGRTDLSSCLSYPEFMRFYTDMQNDMKPFPIGFVTASGFYKYGGKACGRCAAGIEKIAVMPDGSVFPCNLFAGFKEFRLGNIFLDGVEKIWNSPILNQFRTPHKNACRRDDCRHYANCGGGCPAHSYFFYGAIVAADPRCATKKSTFGNPFG